ncbi:sugar ABC transporter substrate-binding protein [Paenibacillus sp. H1-7]|uniref:ABC transporter substrate-binding protein n=1 Tax=Paenibacillus sp. H1-7 TaxID=2282849 RepID=UPI001EF78247|nr:sugar ABC transporter substrate-binding protein [Paenibacillus sp. H1-7]ULL16102.1 sugar ABC transporter substrate-binding protein [Paenibacillus sp. H1-7]
MNGRRKLFKAGSVSMVSLIALLVLAGCNGSGAKPTDTNPNGQTSLSIMWWGADARHQATLKALDIYSQQHTNVKFKPEYLAWEGYWSKLTTLAASKTMTDVLQMDGAYIQDYAGRGTLEDLSDIDLKGVVDPKIVDYLKINGKLYGIPLSHNGQGFAYNKAELEAAGIPLPAKDWTWDDYFKFAKDARAKLPKNKYGIADSSSDWTFYQYYQIAQGKGPMLTDGKTFQLDKDVWFRYQNLYKDLRKDGIVPPIEVSKAFVENDPKADPMASGTVMTRGATVGSVSVLEQLMPGKVGVASYPIGPTGGGWAQSTIFLSVSANSKNKQAAKEFVKWFITDKEAGKTLGLTRGIPISESIYKELEPTLEKKDVLAKELLDKSLPKALPFYPAPTGWSEWVQAYQAEMDAVVYGQQSLEDAFKKIDSMGKETAAKVSGKK